MHTTDMMTHILSMDRSAGNVFHSPSTKIPQLPVIFYILGKDEVEVTSDGVGEASSYHFYLAH